MKRLLYALLFAPAIALAVSGDDKFLAAREAYRVGEGERLARVTESLHDHDLEPWAQYWQLSLGVAQNRFEGVDAFLQRYHGSYLAEKLRGEWLRSVGKNADWPTFMAQYPLLESPTAEHVCYSWQARLALNDDRTALEAARTLWLSSDDVPAACQPLMERLVNSDRLNADEIWKRIRSQLEQTRFADAAATGALLADRSAPDLNTLSRIAANPAQYLDRLPQDLTTRRQAREAAIFAVLRLARKDINIAAIRWQGMQEKFPAADRAYVWGQLARSAALVHMPEALGWYDKAEQGQAVLNDDQQAWRVRAALRVSNWPAVLHAVESMTPALAARPEWIFWRARALTAAGRATEAIALYQSICAQPGFYGLLANEELGLPLSLPPRAAAPSSEEMAQASANPGLRQALALFRFDMRVEAVRTWNWTIRTMNDRELLAAAELARRNDVFDRAINTAEKTQFEHDYSLRYVAPYRDTVSPKAEELAIDDSWVYGLMRQESRFVTSARSGVGARGLMQVMPATAQYVARKIGLKDYKPGHVDNLETNVNLGTNYLRMVLDSLDDSPVLACTAYNAGPGRARRWRGDQALEGAIYAETIPFTETRDYVKKVMANSVYYSAVFEEKPKTLKSRLGVIKPRSSIDASKPEDGRAEP